MARLNLDECTSRIQLFMKMTKCGDAKIALKYLEAEEYIVIDAVISYQGDLSRQEEDRLQQSSDFWRERSNKFEIALRQILAVTGPDVEDCNNERYEIAKTALEAAKK